MRRTRLVGAQATLWPDWRHHAFITNRSCGQDFGHKDDHLMIKEASKASLWKALYVL